MLFLVDLLIELIEPGGSMRFSLLLLLERNHIWHHGKLLIEITRIKLFLQYCLIEFSELQNCKLSWKQIENEHRTHGYHGAGG